MSAVAEKQVKGGKVTEEFEVRERTMRGVTYKIRELDVNEYRECLEAVTDPVTGLITMNALNQMLTLRAVSPSIAARSKPLPYPIYRTLESIVVDMHFEDVPEDKPDEPADGTSAEKTDEPDPNP